MDEARLIEKLTAIEALYAGATTTGERIAAERAQQRIIERLKSVQVEDPPIEYKFTLPDMWNRKILIALMRRYGLRPFRYRGQRHTTVMTHASRRFVDETLWPQYLELSKTLESYLNDITDRVISEAVHSDTSDAQEVNEPKQLGLGLSDRNPTPTDTAPPAQPAPAQGASSTRGGGEVPAAPPNKRPGRNQPCWCGSGKKFKRCHGRSDSN